MEWAHFDVEAGTGPLRCQDWLCVRVDPDAEFEDARSFLRICASYPTMIQKLACEDPETGARGEAIRYFLLPDEYIGCMVNHAHHAPIWSIERDRPGEEEEATVRRAEGGVRYVFRLLGDPRRIGEERPEDLAAHPLVLEHPRPLIECDPEVPWSHVLDALAVLSELDPTGDESPLLYPDPIEDVH